MEYSGELTGMSGDIIMRNETGNITKVGGPRLEEQGKKQEFFSMTHDNIHFFVPPILSKGYLDETRYQIIMPYIQGNLLTSLLLSSSDAHIIRSYAQRVFGVLQYFGSSHLSYEKTVHNASYHSHLLTILDQKSEKLSLSKRVVHLFRDKLEGIDTDSGNASFLCHGDLHLDNMIIGEDEKVWLIDFIPVQFPHFRRDIAKVFQQYTSRCTIVHGTQIPTKKKEVFQEEIFSALKKYFPHYLSYHNVLLAHGLMRLLPSMAPDSRNKLGKNEYAMLYADIVDLLQRKETY